MIPELEEIWLCPASPALLNQVLPESDASRTPLEFFSALSSKGFWFVFLGILTTTAGTAELIAVCFTAALAEKYGAFTEAKNKLSDDQADALKRSISSQHVCQILYPHRCCSDLCFFSYLNWRLVNNIEESDNIYQMPNTNKSAQSIAFSLDVSF